MQAAALLIGPADAVRPVALALARQQIDSLAVPDAVGAMSTFGRTPLCALVAIGGPSVRQPLDVASMFRLARLRHRRLALVVVGARPDGPAEDFAGLNVVVVDSALPDAIAAAVVEAVRECGSLSPTPAGGVDARFDEDTFFDDPTLFDPRGPPLLRGELGAGTGAALLCSVFGQELTGRLEVKGGGPATGTLYFARGEPVAADHADGDSGIAALLVKDGLVVAEQLPQRALTRPLIAELSHQGVVGPDKLMAFLQELVRARVIALVDATAGTYSFFGDDSFLESRVLTPVNSFGLLFETRRKRMPPMDILRGHDELMPQYVVPGVGLARAASRLVRFTNGVDLSALINGQRTAKVIVDAAALDPLMGALVLLTLADARLITLSPTPSHAALPVTRRHVIARPEPLSSPTPRSPSASSLPWLTPENAASAAAGPASSSPTPWALAPTMAPFGSPEPAAALAVRSPEASSGAKAVPPVVALPPFVSAEGDAELFDEPTAPHDPVARMYLALGEVTDPYLVLGVAPGATRDAIDEAYESSVAVLHATSTTNPGMRSRVERLRKRLERARVALLDETGPLEVSHDDEGTEPLPPSGRRYELLERLGRGGMAEVFVGRQIGMQGFAKRVVLKRILPELSTNKMFIDMFLEEARVAARITHPNVVSIFDVGRSGRDYYIVMEHVDGIDLNTALALFAESGLVLPVEICARIVADVAAALHAAHSYVDENGAPSPIIHRDVSPHNVLMSKQGHVKLADFGIAKPADSRLVTAAGIYKGKTSFLSPEYLNGWAADARSDIFAAGITLYLLITGVHPFVMQHDASVMINRLMRAEFDPIDAHRAGVPDELVSVVSKAMARQPAERFHTARAMQAALEEFITTWGRPAATHVVGEWVERALAAPSSPGAMRMDPVRVVLVG